MRLPRRLSYYINNKRVILFLAIANLLGAIYGFYWYKNQLLASPKPLWLFIPDSPLATLLFSIFLFLLFFNISQPFIEALASITIFKYGIWAVVIILWGAWSTEPSIVKILMVETIDWLDVMLICTHLIMAAQALIFFRKYTYGFVSVLIVALWVFFNDILDYTLLIFPWLPASLYDSVFSIAKFTMLLTGTSVLLFYVLTMVRRKRAD